MAFVNIWNNSRVETLHTFWHLFKAAQQPFEVSLCVKFCTHLYRAYVLSTQLGMVVLRVWFWSACVCVCVAEANGTFNWKLNSTLRPACLKWNGRRRHFGRFSLIPFDVDAVSVCARATHTHVIVFNNSSHRLQISVPIIVNFFGVDLFALHRTLNAFCLVYIFEIEWWIRFEQNMTLFALCCDVWMIFLSLPPRLTAQHEWYFNLVVIVACACCLCFDFGHLFLSLLFSKCAFTVNLYSIRYQITYETQSTSEWH